jgi:hypothetical protein
VQRLVILNIVILVLSAVFAVGQARAEVTASPKPTVKINEAMSVTNVAIVKCWGGERMPWTVRWTRRSLVGILVWRYGLTITEYCWSGKKVLSIKSHRWGKTYVPLWDYTGHIDQERDWNARWSFRRWTEGRFVWTRPIGVAVRTPEVWFKVRGDGYVSYGAVGD